MEIKKQRPDSKNIQPIFNLDLVAIIPGNLDRALLEQKYLEALQDARSGNVFRGAREAIGIEITAEKINQLFQFSQRGIRSQTLMLVDQDEDYVDTTTVLCSFKEGEMRYSGLVRLTFGHLAKPELFIRQRDLSKTGEGLGMEIQCRLEKFCRENNIWEIHNIASSKPADDVKDKQGQAQIGAYVWARCGFEFKNIDDLLAVRGKLAQYLADNNIISEKNINSLERPIDFATLRGKDKKGIVIPVGKLFLTSADIKWEGIKDLKLDSLGTEDFMRYLTEKGRTDLIEKYLT